ncbi:winged helix-turn-helix domain-containing protein, partial [Alistipes putredinis]|nr:winged helix-turn-helix domain-containing protein [Alistipes putredinis]
MSKNSICFDDKELELTKNEFRILNCLMKNKGKIVSRGDLMDYLWDLDLFIDDNTLTVNINRLRK